MTSAATRALVTAAGSLLPASTSAASEERTSCNNLPIPLVYQATPAVRPPIMSHRRCYHTTPEIEGSVAARMAVRTSGETKSASEKVKAGKADPFFREVWRKFQLKVHPDLFAKYPELQKANSESLQKLQGILNECKSGTKCLTEILQPRTETLEFYLRTDKDNAFMRLPLTVRIPAGDCRNVLATTFAALFKQANLPTRFHWGPEYWQSTYSLPPRVPGEDE